MGPVEKYRGYRWKDNKDLQDVEKSDYSWPPEKEITSATQLPSKFGSDHTIATILEMQPDWVNKPDQYTRAYESGIPQKYLSREFPFLIEEQYPRCCFTDENYCMIRIREFFTVAGKFNLRKAAGLVRGQTKYSEMENYDGEKTCHKS